MGQQSRWTPRIPILPKNHIISSDFTTTKPFIPAYTKEPEDMQMIMSNAYAKKWHQEKAVFKKLADQEKVENEVFLMRRYVIRGLNQKMKNMEALKAVPSRIKVGKKVPYAVRLRPKDTSEPSKNVKNVPKKPSDLSLKTKKHENKLHVSIVEKEKPNCLVAGEPMAITADLGPTSTEMKKLGETCDHVHVEEKGNEFVVHRVKCAEGHHHGCDCTEFDPEEPPCLPCLE